MRHLYATKDQKVIAQAKDFERRRCGHHELETPLSTLECLKSVVDPKDNHTNKHRYVGAIQDEDVRRFLRSIPGVPLVYINRSVMIMEPMGGATEGYRMTEEKAKFKAGIKARINNNLLGKRKRDDEKESDEEGSDSGSAASDEGEDVENAEEAEAQEQPKPRKRRGPKGVNPLALKKPKKRTTAESTAQPHIPSTDSSERPRSAAKSSDNSGPTTREVESEPRRKRKRKPSSWKKDIIDKALSLPAEAAAG
jgi:U3 small nucleolar RNA-associated protein 23